MKTIFSRITGLGLCLVLFLMGCSKVEDTILQDIDFYVNTDIVNPVLSAVFVDASLNSNVPEGVTFEILGKDKGDVFNLLGEQNNFELDGNNVLHLATTKDRLINEANPLEFAIRASAPGYLENIQNFSLTKNEFFNFPLVKISEPVKGISNVQGQVTSNGTGVVDAMHFETPLVDGKREKVMVDIPQGTQLLDANGYALEGDIDVTISHTDDRQYNVKALPTFTGGSEMHVLSRLFFDLRVDKKHEVVAFTEPISVRVTLNPEAIHPDFGRPIRDGDVVDIMSFEESLGEWQVEGKAYIEENNGKLEVAYKQKHLSVWYIGFRRGCGNSGTVINISNTDVGINDPERYYYTEIYTVAGDETTLKSTNSFRFYDGEKISLIRSGDFEALVIIYEGTADCLGDVLFVSPIFNACGEILNWDLTNQLIPIGAEFVDITVNVQGTCSNEYNNLIIKPSLPILFRKAGCNSWSLLGLLINGNGTTSSLQKGESYDFRIDYRGIERLITNLEVPKVNTEIPIESPIYDFYEVINVVYGDEGTSLTFEYLDIEVPDLACQEYVNHFQRISTPRGGSAENPDDTENGGSSNGRDPD